MRLFVLLAGLALFGASLFFPAIIFKPTTAANPKYVECSVGVGDDVVCEAFTFGGSGPLWCGKEKDPAKTYIDKRKILDYCKGWDAPFAGAFYGYDALLMGWMSVFFGMFAWIANPLMLLAVIQSAIGMRRAAMFVSVCAVAFGLLSFTVAELPRDNGSMASGTLNVVDRLGPGFYLWMGALVAFAVYCSLRKKVAAKTLSAPS